jgi:hypothetical protein
MTLAQLSNDEIMAQLATVCAEGNRLTARLIAILVEVEERRLHLELACSSMFDFCVRTLGLSEGAAVRRLNAARLVKRYPQILGRIERGEVHLSALQMLAPHFTPQNVDAVMEGAAHKSKAEVEQLRARIAPVSDVLPMIRPLTPPPAEAAPARLAPLSETRHELRVTVSSALREKIERARDLMAHANPGWDLANVIEQGIELLLAKLEKQRLGKAAKPRPPSRTKAGRVARAVRREVFERDGSQCTFVSDDGERCPARARLELDHIEARALGGADDAGNLRVRCRAHNRLHAERVFGKERVAHAIHLRQRRCDDDPFQTAARGLTKMGFRAKEAKRALAAVRERHAAESVPVGDVVREALALVT